MKPIAIARTAFALVALLIPTFASAAWSFSFSIGSGDACVSSYIGCLGTQIINIINGVLVPVVFALAFIVFLYGIAKAYIFSAGEPEEVAKGHKLLMWGIIAFVVMLSLWGLVNVVAGTFGLGGVSAPQTPSSIPSYGNETIWIEQPQ